MAHKQWVIRDADKERASEISEKLNIDPFIAFLLVSRGVTDEVSVTNFIDDKVMLVSPFNFADMEEAAFTIGDAIDNGEKICIYGDYDCDGVTATALLYLFLREEGADVCYYIPSREAEGYGLHREAIEAIKDRGVSLIITVDNGISALEEAEYIYALGMRLVVTDHHQLAEALPKAEAVVNPHREENELTFREYCGVGVAFKLICAMYEGEIDALVEKYMDLVAIGTIADVVPLTDENRAFVRAGLHLINHHPRPALKAFAASGGEKEYNATDIAFRLCPRLNAMGRMGDAARAVEFLICEDSEDCAFRMEQLNLENAHRQEIEETIIRHIEEQIQAHPKLVAGRVIVIAGKGYHQGVIGIVASHFLEKYAKPTFIIGIDENGIARGSGRSIEGFHLYEAISACSEDFIQFGGHPLAAGITLAENKIDAFRKHINEYAIARYEMMPPQQLVLDCKLSPAYLTLDLVEHLSVLEPYGAGNPQAVFGIYKVKLISVTPLKEGKHIRLELEKQNRRFHVVKFGTAYDDFPYAAGDILNVAVRVAKNFFRQKTYLSVQAVDIHLALADDEKYFREKNAYETFRLTGKGSQALYPSRENCADIYRYLKKNNGYAFSPEDLYFRLQDKVTYARLMVALKAFSQAGLIRMDKTIIMNEIQSKVDLEQTPILQSLKERLRID